MPIRLEEKARYPKNWKDIRAHILERANNKCERCSVKNHVYGYWKGETFQELEGEPTQQWDAMTLDGIKIIRIVLTVAHLDHIPENCADNNLQALCQRCHNRLDMPSRVAGRKERKEMAIGQMKLEL